MSPRPRHPCRLMCGRDASATHAVASVRMCAACFARVQQIAADNGVVVSDREYRIDGSLERARAAP